MPAGGSGSTCGGRRPLAAVQVKVKRIGHPGALVWQAGTAPGKDDLGRGEVPPERFSVQYEHFVTLPLSVRDGGEGVSAAACGYGPMPRRLLCRVLHLARERSADGKSQRLPGVGRGEHDVSRSSRPTRTGRPSSPTAGPSPRAPA